MAAALEVTALAVNLAAIRARTERALLLARRRSSSDPLGRSSIVLTGALGSGSLCILWALSVLGAELLDRDVFSRTLGIGASTAAYGDGTAFSLDDIKALRRDPGALVACERATTALLPNGTVLPVRQIATTPPFFRYRAGRLRAGRRLTWADTLTRDSRAVVGAALAGFASTSLDLGGRRLRPIGILEARIGDGDDLVAIELLRSDAIEETCGNARRTIAVIADPPMLTSVRTRLARTLALRRGLPPGIVQLEASIPPRAGMLWTRTRLGARGVLFGTTALIAVMASLSMAILLEVRNHGRRFELGVARALGATRRDLTVELLIEAAGLALASVCVGLVPCALVVYVASAAAGLSVPWMVIVGGPAILLLILMSGAAIWPIATAVRQAPICDLNADVW